MATLATILDRFTRRKSFEQEAPRPRILEEEDRYAVPQFPNEDVYLYVKHIDNSRVAREADPAAPRRLLASDRLFFRGRDPVDRAFCFPRYMD